MKKIFSVICLFLPLMAQAQTELTPQQQLEAAQKQLEAAQKQLEAAQKAAEQAKKSTQKAEQKAEQTAKQKAEDTQAAGGWVVPQAAVAKPKTQPVAKNNKGEELKDDPKYLDGAVVTDDKGKVVYTTTLQAPGKSAGEIYQLLYDYMGQLTLGENNIASRTALVNKDTHTIANTMDEYIVFNNSFISLDRTECKYTLVAVASDGKADITLHRISYNYEPGRSTGFKLPAEEVIIDKYALNKKKTSLAKIYGKFRRGTIDRKDQIFNEMKALLQ